MKFLPQDMFETFALTMSKYKTIDENAYNEIKREIYSGYKNDYSGDTLWLSQAEQVVPYAIQLVTKLGAKDKFRSLDVAAELRQKFDEDMKPLSGIKKTLRGTFFTKSHPAPQLRIELAQKNISLLFIQMGSAGFIHK